jgi:hypothetical protein
MLILCLVVRGFPLLPVNVIAELLKSLFNTFHPAALGLDLALTSWCAIRAAETCGWVRPVDGVARNAAIGLDMARPAHTHVPDT